MSRYNAHKRATLDRLTLTYQLAIREALREDLSRLEVEMVHALERLDGQYEPTPSASTFDKIALHFERHQRQTILVGFSDGIQEVSPENKLGAWEQFPISMAVEKTLTSQLADSRNRWTQEFIRKYRKTLAARLQEYTANTQSAYLKKVRESWAFASRRWLQGEADTGMVRAYLSRTLQQTDNEAERTLRTETTNYFNESRQNYFATETAVDYVQLYAVTDGRISNICEARHGFVVPIGKAGEKKYLPAFHPHCRTVQRALFSTLKAHKLLIDKGLAMNEASFPPLPNGWA
jgi:SPP1 gp7 family putative phage head morphogenesis protein